mmetsp:Transcript_41360/g.113800  ORF Transcript_41360/g.113800 Transcript_41360/m.113800 type:complete len:315 (+) Transcript_41360:1237-2181(+)
MSVLGAERQNWINPILASFTLVGPPAACATFWVKTKPGTSSVSSIVPPSFFTTAMSRRSTLVAVAGSMTASIASTASGASSPELFEMTFELSEVEAALMSSSRLARSSGTDMFSRISSDLRAARRKPSEMTVGWMPFLSRMSAAFSSAPAMTVTVVVPSPASMSCDLDRSTSILAVGCETSICFKMVAPSLVIITSPCPLWIILSMPRGPRLVRTASATARAAMMLLSRTLRAGARRGAHQVRPSSVRRERTSRALPLSLSLPASCARRARARPRRRLRCPSQRRPPRPYCARARRCRRALRGQRRTPSPAHGR